MKKIPNATPLEWWVARIERALGFGSVIGAVLCYALWVTDRSKHGEVAFFWAFSIMILSVGLSLLAASYAIQRQWPAKMVYQILVVLVPAVVWHVLI
jgi:hypothetical protein